MLGCTQLLAMGLYVCAPRFERVGLLGSLFRLITLEESHHKMDVEEDGDGGNG